MEEIAITSYTDGEFRQVHKDTDTFPFHIDSIMTSKGVEYAEDRRLGTTNGSNSFVRYKPEKLILKGLWDSTGAMEDDDWEGIRSVRKLVDKLEEYLYCYNSDGHRPSFVKVEYGDFLFFGQLEQLETNYSMFDAGDVPRRANVDLTLKGYCSTKEEKSRFSKRSPDVSRLVTLKEGQTLASLCNDIYGDPLLVGQVARFNNLNGYRDIPAGTEILMPMLKK